MVAAGAIGPGNVERDRLLERGLRQFARDVADGVGGDAGVGRRRLGSRPRTAASQPVAVASASSQEISANSPEPRGPMRLSGARSRAGEVCCMMPAEPLPHSTPLLTG